MGETDTQGESEKERDQLHIRLNDYEEVVKNSDDDVDCDGDCNANSA